MSGITHENSTISRLGRAFSSQPDVSVQLDGPPRAHFHTGPAAAASIRVHLDGSFTEADRLGRTSRLASTAKRTRFFINARHGCRLATGRRHQDSGWSCHLIAYPRWDVSPHTLALPATPPAPHSTPAPVSTTATSPRSRSVTSRHDQAPFCWAASSSAIRLLISSSAPSRCSAWVWRACASCSADGAP